MRKNRYDVPVDWGKLSSHKPSKHAKSEKQIYWAKIRMAEKTRRNMEEDQELLEAYDRAEREASEQYRKEYLEEREDYEPVIKDEKVRKAVRAWAEANGETEVVVNSTSLVTAFTGVHKQLDLELIYSWKVDGVYTITELCGEEEE